MEFNIIKKERVTSTNDILKRDAERLPCGTVIAAKEQTDGRGRTGRSFYSPPTGLYFSVLLKDIKETTSTLTLIAATAVMKGIYDAFGIKTQVKWVNDIFYNGRKICGILTEGRFLGRRLSYAVVGIGINLSTEKFPDDIKDIAGSLSADAEKSDYLLDCILRNLSSELESADSGEYLEYYTKNCLTLNKKVRLVSPLSEEDAFAVGIGDSGELTVRTESGETKNISYGEAKII